jgi:F5/8 type C domain
MRSAASLLAVSVALGLVACGGNAGKPGAGGVRDFGDVQVGTTKVETHPGGTEAVIRVTTDPATVCAVAVGKSEALGRIANDPNMRGTAITEHAVVLRNLVPSTTYRYRLTATDAAADVYQTPGTLTFETRPAAKASAGASGPDLALHAKVVDVSSVYSSAFAASNALDGALATEWSSNGDGDHAFLTIDLGKRVAVTGVAFRTREMGDGSAITRSFSVVVAGGKRYGPFRAGDRRAARIAAVSFTGRILSFEVDKSTGGNTGAAEIEVYGAGG